MSRRREKSGGAQRRRGFTLVEVLVAILVLLIGVVVALRIFPSGFAIFTRTQQAGMGMQQVKDVLQTLSDHPENLPDSIEPASTTGFATASGNVLTFGSLPPAGSSIIPAGVVVGMNCSVVGDPTIYIVTAIGASTVTINATPQVTTSALWTFFDPILPAYFTWSNLSAITLTGFQFQSYGFGGTGGQWPLDEPLSLRVLRRVVGERCVIPPVVATSSGWYAPNYCVRYGPIEQATPLQIYDLRYRRLNQNKFAGMMNAPDQLYYDINYGSSANNNVTPALPAAAATLYFPSSASGQSIRLSFSYENASSAIMQYPATLVTIPSSGGSATMATLNLSTFPNSTTPLLPSGDFIVPGSEVIYRAYTSVLSSSPPVIPTLVSGQYYLQYRNSIATDPVGLIYFAQADAGRSVKIDYTVLDWNIMHDDVTVDQTGAVELGLLPKIADQPLPPFETKTWGLYAPITNNSIVMEMVNLQTGADSPVTVDNPEQGIAAPQPGVAGCRNYAFSVNGATYYLVQDPNNSKRFYISGAGDGQFLGQSGKAFAGQTFRIFYRAVHDWSLQIFRAPATFQQGNSPLANQAALSSPLQLQWSQFAWAPNGAITATSTAASNPGSTPPSGTITFASVPAGVVVGMSCSETSVPADPTIYTVTAVTPTTITVAPALPATPVQTASWTFAGNAWLAVQGFFAGQTLAVDYTYAGNAANNQPPLVQVSGEVHTVPPPAVGQTLSQMLLAHCPAPGTTVSVRGISVTVRALWTQPHSGSQMTLGNTATPVTGSISESWLSRQATSIMPANTE